MGSFFRRVWAGFQEKELGSRVYFSSVKAVRMLHTPSLQLMRIWPPAHDKYLSIIGEQSEPTECSCQSRFVALEYWLILNVVPT